MKKYNYSRVSNMECTENILDSVILKIEYSRIPNFEREKFVSVFSQEYPQEKIQKRTEFSTTFSQGKQTIDQNSYNEYRYYDNEMENYFCISESYAFFELKKHFGFPKLQGQFKKIFDILLIQFGLESISRIGLRYINKVNTKKINLSLEKSISKPLLSNRNFYVSIIKPKHQELKMSLCLGQISFKNENTTTNFVFGNPNPNYPAIMVDENENFLLDYDSFSTNVHKDDIFGILDKLHTNIKLLFEDSLTNELRNKIKP